MGILSGLPDFFGLDIGTTAVRVVQLKGKGSGRAVFRYGKAPIDPAVAGKTDVDSLAKLADTIREVLVQNQVTTRNVVMGLPTHKVYSVVREFDYMPASEFAKTLKFQIERIIPSHEESKIDWAVLDPEVKEADKKEVLICSSANDFIQQRLEVLESINLNVLAFEPDSLALVRSMTNANTPHDGLIVDIGYSDCDIIVMHKNQPRLITSVPVGINNAVMGVINSMQLDNAQAQQLIFQFGLYENPNYPSLRSSVVQAFDMVIIQIRKSIDFFANRYMEGSLSQLTLCGDAAYIPGFAEFIAAQAGIQVVVGDAWQNVVCPQEIHEDLKNLSTNFAVAAGLAERQAI